MDGKPIEGKFHHRKCKTFPAKRSLDSAFHVQLNVRRFYGYAEHYRPEFTDSGFGGKAGGLFRKKDRAGRQAFWLLAQTFEPAVYPQKGSFVSCMPRMRRTQKVQYRKFYDFGALLLSPDGKTRQCTRICLISCHNTYQRSTYRVRPTNKAALLFISRRRFPADLLACSAAYPTRSRSS